MSNPDDILLEIKERRGAVKRLAEACSLTTQAVSQWRRVPKKHLAAVARVTGRTPEELRPDLWANDNAPEPPPSGGAAKHPEKREAA